MVRAKRKRVAIYARVSTDGQTVANQVRELEEAARRHGWHVAEVFRDHAVSGAKPREERAGFAALSKAITRKEIDLVAAWSVDRLGRSLQDLVGLLGELHAKGVDLYLHQQGVDTTTPAGRAMFQMLGVFAEFERSMIRERVLSGLKRARAAGTRLGRPTIPPKKEAAVRAALAAGDGIRKAARAAGVGSSAVQRIKAKMKAEAPS